MDIPNDDKIKKLLTSKSDNDVNKGLDWVVKKFRKDIIRFLSKSSYRLSETEKDELFQIIIIELWDNIKKGKYNRDGNLKAYLSAIAGNQALKYIRNKKKRIEENYGPDQLEKYSNDPNNEEAERNIQELRDIALQNNIRQLDECVELLDEENRDIFLLYYEDNQRVKEIAVALGQNENWVKQRLFITRKKLKHCRKEKESHKHLKPQSQETSEKNTTHGKN